MRSRWSTFRRTRSARRSRTRSRWRRRRPSRYGTDICIGMSVAHQQGIIHRDLKPANILINDTGLLKIVDFGVAAAAKSGDTQLTKTGYVIGSPKYMAPEQILGKKVDERADIYSLGVIMYEMLAGNPPYSRGDHMSVMYQHVQGKAQPLNEANPKVPREIADVVTKTMQVDKAEALRLDGRAAPGARSRRRCGQVEHHGTYRRILEVGARAGLLRHPPSGRHSSDAAAARRSHADQVPRSRRHRARGLRRRDLERLATRSGFGTRTTSTSRTSAATAGGSASTCSTRRRASAPRSATSRASFRASTASTCRRSCTSSATCTKAWCSSRAPRARASRRRSPR